MIASKVICDDTYSNQSWVIVAQKLFALQEINQMEREMCVYLEWNLNVQGDEIVDFEALIRSEHGSKAIAASSPSPGPTSVLPVNAYPTPGMTRDRSQPIQQVPSPYMSRPQQVVQSQISLPSPPVSSAHHLLSSALTPQPPHFATAIASLASSPVSDDCRTPPAITVITAACRSMKSRSLAHLQEQGTTTRVQSSIVCRQLRRVIEGG
jgi:hypothetical protein